MNNNIAHRLSSKPSPIESMTSKNSSKPRSKSPFNANLNQKPESMAKKPLRRESTAISTLHPDTLYDNKHKERRSTMMNSSSVHNENHPNNISKNNEGKTSKTDKLQKFAKFNNSKLFKEKVVAEPSASSRITPFRMDVSGKDSAFSNQELKDSVLARPFPFLGKGNQENMTPRNMQDPLNYSSIELVTSQMQSARRISTEGNALNFSNLEPINNQRTSLENSMMLTSGRKSLRLGCPDSISKSPYEPKFETKMEEISTQLPPPSFETIQGANLAAEQITENSYVPQEKEQKKPIGLTFVLSVLLVVLVSALAFSIQQKNSFSPVENLLTKIQTTLTPSDSTIHPVEIHDERLLTKNKYLNFISQV